MILPRRLPQPGLRNSRLYPQRTIEQGPVPRTVPPKRWNFAGVWTSLTPAVTWQPQCNLPVQTNGGPQWRGQHNAEFVPRTCIPCISLLQVGRDWSTGSSIELAAKVREWTPWGKHFFFPLSQLPAIWQMAKLLRQLSILRVTNFTPSMQIQ